MLWIKSGKLMILDGTLVNCPTCPPCAGGGGGGTGTGTSSGTSTSGEVGCFGYELPQVLHARLSGNSCGAFPVDVDVPLHFFGNISGVNTWKTHADITGLCANGQASFTLVCNGSSMQLRGVMTYLTFVAPSQALSGGIVATTTTPDPFVGTGSITFQDQTGAGEITHPCGCGIVTFDIVLTE